MTIITSKANNVVKKAKKLQQKKYRKTSYLIEGWHLFEEAVASKAEILTIFATQDQKERLVDFSQVQWVTPEILADLADSKTPQGIVAELVLPSQSLPSDLKGRYLLLEDIQDPGNVGTMVRTADAAGYTGVILSSKAADLYNMKTLRSMQGSHFHLPVYRMEIGDFLDQAQQAGLPVLATTLSEDSVSYKDLKAPLHFVLVMGNEGQGISKEMAERADQLVHIPMPGQAESLNVAVAAGILMFALS